MKKLHDCGLARGLDARDDDEFCFCAHLIEYIMHFAESKKILERLKDAHSILINVHRNPDLDSVGSTLAFKHILNGLGKNVTIIGPHPVEPSFHFLPGVDKIKTVDFHTFDFMPFDLFLVLDSASAQIVTSDPKLPLPPLPRVVIDHHIGNTIEAHIKLVKEDASATAEIIYYLLRDWKINIPKDLATILFSAICHDTVFFKYSENDNETYPIISDLIRRGADKNAVLFNIYNNLGFEFVKSVASVLSKMRREKGFVWAALSHEEYKKMGCPVGLREYVSDHFIQSVEDTWFGFVIIEEDPGKLCIGFRSKTGLDISILAKKLGGGGHLYRAGATVYEKDFEKGVKKILHTARLTTACPTESVGQRLIKMG